MSYDYCLFPFKDDPLKLIYLPPNHWRKPPTWEVQKPIEFCNSENYKYAYYSLPREITVPCSFMSDGASVPRFLWWLFSPTGNHFTASILHDYLYKQGDKLSWNSRYNSDKIFYHVMLNTNVPKWRALIMYYENTVRLFGET